MSFTPFSFFNLFNLSSFRGLNWFEGLKRIKVFLQWLWGVPAGIIFLIFALSWRAELGGVLLGLLAVTMPLLGFELLFRAVVWIVAGFIQVGDPKAETIRLAESQRPAEVKKKITEGINGWIGNLKKTSVRELCDTVFFFVWIYLLSEVVGNTWLNPLAHWQNVRVTISLESLNLERALTLVGLAMITLFKGIVTIVLGITGFAIYAYFSEKSYRRKESKKETQ